MAEAQYISGRNTNSEPNEVFSCRIDAFWSSCGLGAFCLSVGFRIHGSEVVNSYTMRV